MFNLNDIKKDNAGRYICKCVCASKKDAEFIVASYISSVRQLNLMNEIYFKDNVVFIDTLDNEMTHHIASEINKKLNS